MRTDLLRTLLETTFAASAAVLLVYALRKPMRPAAGTRVAYLLWILVPAMTIAATKNSSRR